jgi:hypothetical protein
MSGFGHNIRPLVQVELVAAGACLTRREFAASFRHLERAHVLGQSSTVEHVRVHWRMLLWSVKRRDAREAAGQIFRIIGATAMTGVGLVPDGNTGGSNVSPFLRMPVPADLADIIAEARLAIKTRLQWLLWVRNGPSWR